MNMSVEAGFYAVERSGTSALGISRRPFHVRTPLLVRRGGRPCPPKAPHSSKPSVGGDAHIAPYATAAPWHQASLCEGGGMAEGHAGGRDVTRNSLPQSASPTAPSQRGPRIRTSPPCKPSPAAKALSNSGPWPPSTFAASRQRRDLIIAQTPRRVFPKREGTHKPKAVGKEDSVKETRQGFLSRSVKKRFLLCKNRKPNAPCAFGGGNRNPPFLKPFFGCFLSGKKVTRGRQ